MIILFTGEWLDFDEDDVSIFVRPIFFDWDFLKKENL